MIQFNTNGTFAQQFYLNGVCKYTNEGKWVIEKKPGKFNPTSHIVLSPFICAFDTRAGKLQQPPINYGVYYADWDESRQRIEFNLETGYFVTKTNAVR